MNQPTITIKAPEAASQTASLYSNNVQSAPSSTAADREVERLKEELRRTRQAAKNLSAAYQKLLEISRSVTQLREPDEMFQRVLDAAVKVTGAERGFLFLLPSHSESSVDNLTVAAAHNIRPEEITRGRFRVSRSAISHSLKHGVPVVKGGGSGDPSQSMADFGLRAILCEPLIIQTRVLGILYLDTSQKSSFSRPHAELLRSFGAQAAVCLANIRLMQAREEDSRRQHAQAAQRESLNAFLTVASRELRDPVTVLATGIRLLKLDRLDERTNQLVVGDLERSIQKAERMLHSYDILREFQEGRAPKVYKQVVPVRSLLEERVAGVFQLLGPDLRSKFQIHIEAAEEDVILADRVRLSHILDCLLQNSVSHSLSGGILRLWFEEDSDSQRICMEDQGVTIEPGQVEAIQEGRPKMNAGLSKRGEQLGLFVAANLVKAHEGELEVASDDFTRFTIRLPG